MVSEMTYNVLSGMLNPTDTCLLILPCRCWPLSQWMSTVLKLSYLKTQKLLLMIHSLCYITCY